MTTSDRKKLIASFVLNLTSDARNLLIRILEGNKDNDTRNICDDGSTQEGPTEKIPAKSYAARKETSGKRSA